MYKDGAAKEIGSAVGSVEKDLAGAARRQW